MRREEVEMEPDLESRVQSLPYKVRSVSRESAAQKAAHVIDPDLRTHWATSTNTKEWLVLELEVLCSHDSYTFAIASLPFSSKRMRLAADDVGETIWIVWCCD